MSRSESTPAGAPRRGVRPPAGGGSVPAPASCPLLVPAGRPLVAGRLYLRLYHGRTDPAAEMDGWGFDGPTFGPLDRVVQAYFAAVLLTGGDCELSFAIHPPSGLIAWDGAYYGNLCLFVAGGRDRG